MARRYPELQRRLYIVKISRSCAQAVRTTTGRRLRLSSANISIKSSRPSILGIFKSRRIRSGVGALKYLPCLRRKFKHCSPSPTVPQVVQVEEHLGRLKTLAHELHVAEVVFDEQNFHRPTISRLVVHWFVPSRQDIAEGRKYSGQPKDSGLT